MNTSTAFRSLSTFVLSILITTVSFSQPPKRVFSQVYFHKIKSGHTFAEARAMENEFKKIHQFQANEGTLNGWYMLAVDVTSNPKKEYDYITINTFSDLGYMDNSYPNAVMEKVMGADYKTKTSDLYKRMQDIKEVVKIEIWEQLEEATASPMPSPDKNPLWRLSGMRVKNGQYSEYIARAKTLKPVFQERINMGDGAGWHFAGVMLPSATEASYDFTAIIQYPSMKALADDKHEAAFRKVIPGTDIQQFYKELEALRETNRDELYYLVEYAVKAPPVQATK